MTHPEVKRVSLDNYMKYFYDLISVNGPNQQASTVSTPIFYKLDDLGILEITFSFEKFIIIVKTPLSRLQQEYEQTFDSREDDSSFVKPALIQWVNDRYMDGRGIQEV